MSPRSSPQPEPRTWPRLRRKRSIAWRFFSESPADPNCAICQLCHAAIPRGRRLARNTTNLLKHLRNKHPQRLSAVLTTANTPWTPALEAAPPASRSNQLGQEQSYDFTTADGGVCSNPSDSPRASAMPAASSGPTLRHAVIQLSVHGLALTGLGEPLRALQQRIIAPLVAETSTNVHLSLSTIDLGCSLVVTRAGKFSVISCCWITAIPEFKKRTVCLAVMPPAIIPTVAEIQNIAKCWGISKKVTCVVYGTLADYVHGYISNPPCEAPQKPRDEADAGRSRNQLNKHTGCRSGETTAFGDKIECASEPYIDQPTACNCLWAGVSTHIAPCSSVNSVSPLIAPGYLSSDRRTFSDTRIVPTHPAPSHLAKAQPEPCDNPQLFHAPANFQQNYPQYASQVMHSNLATNAKLERQLDETPISGIPLGERRSSETESTSFNLNRGPPSSLSSMIPLSECPSRSQSPPLSPYDPQEPAAGGKKRRRHEISNSEKSPACGDFVFSTVKESEGVTVLRTAGVGGVNSDPGRRELHASGLSSVFPQHLTEVVLCSNAALDAALNDGFLKTFVFQDMVSRVRTAVRVAMENTRIYQNHCENLLFGAWVPLVLDDGEGDFSRLVHNMLLRFQSQYLAIRATCIEVCHPRDLAYIEAINTSNISVFITVLVVFMDARRVIDPARHAMEAGLETRSLDATSSVSVCIPTVKGVKRALSRLKFDIGIKTHMSDALDNVFSCIESLFRDLESREVYAAATLLDPRFKSSAFESADLSRQAKQSLFHICTEIQSELSQKVSQSSRDTTFFGGSPDTSYITKELYSLHQPGFNGRQSRCEPTISDGFHGCSEADTFGVAYNCNSDALFRVRESVEHYLSEPVSHFSTNVEQYWRDASCRWPILAYAAAKFLSTSATSSSVGGADSISGVPLHVDPLYAFGEEDAVQMTFLRQNAIYGTRVA